MFGRLRPPPSSPDSLERYPAKIIKHDPLSIYAEKNPSVKLDFKILENEIKKPQSTLLKLKQGSRLDTVGPSSETEVENPSSSPVCSDTQREARDVTLCNGPDAMAIDSGSGESTKQQKNKNPSVLSMFCRYKSQAQARNLSDTVDTTTTETESGL